MGNWMSDILGLIVTFSVSAVVWGTLIAGLYQLVREEIRQVRMALQGSQLEGYSHQAG